MTPQDDSEKLINEYREKRDLYIDFASKIAAILGEVLQNNNLRSQPVSFRAKKTASAAARFQEKECKKLDDLKDLAGCRAIFYLESDIEKAIKQIYETFGRVNILDHDNKISVDGHNGINIVIQLGQDRLVHPEYKRFEGLKCEIQLTTVLHHAWSEMEHDVVYKPQKELLEFDPRAFEAIKKAFADTMKTYIQPAVRSFEHISREYQKLKTGKKVFDQDFLNAILKSDSNNEIQENLKLLLQYVREFGDKTPKGLGLVKFINSILIKSKGLKRQNIKTSFGEFKGAEYREVALTALSILEEIRYLHTKEVINSCFELIAGEEDSKTIEQAEEVLKKICDYDLRILQNIGYFPQETALRFVEPPNILNNPKMLRGISNILAETLTLSFRGLVATAHDTYALQSGALVASDKIQALRTKALRLTKKLYLSSKSLKERMGVLGILAQATRWPDSAVVGDELAALILSSVKNILNFYSKIIDTAENEIIKEIEHRLIFLEKNPRQSTAQAKKILGKIRQNQDYQVFKALVGYDVYFYPDSDFKKAADYRNSQVEQYTKEISEKNLPYWKGVIIKISTNYKDTSPDSYEYLFKLLRRIGESKPEIALKLSNEKLPEPFLAHLVTGVWSSKLNDAAKKLIMKWTREYKNFFVCASIFGQIKKIDRHVFEAVARRALQKKDAKALNRLVYSISQNYAGEKWLKDLLLKIICSLGELEDTSWVHYVWFKADQVLKGFQRREFLGLLDGLLTHPQINHEVEAILEPIAEQYPADIVDFFLKRVKIKSRKKRSQLFDYDAIPFHLYKIGESLAKKSTIIVPEIIKWYSMSVPEKDKWLYRWEASQLLKEIFPNNDPVLENELLKIIRRGGEGGRSIIDYFIGRFEGQDFLWTLVEEIINTYGTTAEYPKIKSGLFGYLSQTGVVSGEYGFVQAHSKKKEALKGLKGSSNKNFVKFIDEYEEYLSKAIAGAQKMADDEIDKRKREFGTS